MPEPNKKPFNPFGNVYRIDSVAGQEGLDEPRYVVLTNDSLFQAFGYWDYSFPYETELRTNDSLQVLDSMNEKYTIKPAAEKIWLNFPNGKGILCSQGFANYDSACKHLRMIKTQGKDLLRCRLDDSSILNQSHKSIHSCFYSSIVVCITTCCG